MPNIPYLFCVLSYSSSNLFLYIRPKLFKSICFCFLHIPAIFISLALSNWVLQNTWVELLKIHTVKSMCFCFTYSDNLHKFGALNWGLQNTWAALSRMYMVKDICFRTKTYTVRSMYFSFLYLGEMAKYILWRFQLGPTKHVSCTVKNAYWWRYMFQHFAYTVKSMYFLAPWRSISLELSALNSQRPCADMN